MSQWYPRERMIRHHPSHTDGTAFIFLSLAFALGVVFGLMIAGLAGWIN